MIWALVLIGIMVLLVLAMITVFRRRRRELG
jgi:LPXTG-motif cell wall-anchored protein